MNSNQDVSKVPLTVSDHEPILQSQWPSAPTTMTEGQSIISKLTGFYIKQKFTPSCFGTTKVFRGYYPNSHPSDKLKSKLFKCTMNAPCMSACTPSSCRSFVYDVELYAVSHGIKMKYKFLRLVMNSNFTCLCCSAPTVRVEYVEMGGSEVLGYVRFPYNFCKVVGYMYDESSFAHPKYEVVCEACQLAICGQIEMDIYEGKAHNKIGTVSKVFAGMIREMAHLDNFIVNYPYNLPWKDKCLFIGHVVLLDMLYFEGKDSSK
jgi:hypothetical protein